MLGEYVKNGSEEAIRELVSRHINLVYSTAIRLVDGDSLLAQDVTQTVFLHLARSARKLARDSMLAGWLHRDACFVAAKIMRGERRRRARELQAVFMNSLQDHSAANLENLRPVLDEAINQLGLEDRAAILLRYFEQRDFRSVAEALGSSEDAARMRIARALDKLRLGLKRRGVAFSVGTLSTIMATHAVTAAPAGLAAGISTAALAGAAMGGGTLGVLKLLTMTKLKLGLTSAVIAAGILTPWVLQERALANLREQNLTLQRQVAQLAPAPTENQRLSNQLTSIKTRSLPNDQFAELLRLRGKAGVQSSELARLRAELTASRNSKVAREQAAKYYFPKSSWASAGYATPEAAVQSTEAWAKTRNNLKEALADLSPDEQASVLKYFAGKTESEIAAEFAQEAQSFEKIDGLRIINTETVADDEVVVT